MHRKNNIKLDSSDARYLELNMPERIEGHPAQLVHSYDELVDWSNRMRQSR